MTTPLPPGGITTALLGPLLATDPHRPRLIWHGAGRTELSTASLANWSAKTAGLLDDESGADEVIIASSHPFGLASGQIAEYARHVADAVLPQADRFAPRRPAATVDSVAVLTTDGSFSVGEILRRATRAGELLGSGGRVLSVVNLTLPDRVCT